MVHSIFIDKEIIDYNDYLLPKTTQNDIIEIDLQASFDPKLLTYEDANPIDETDYFLQEQQFIIDGYNAHKNDLIDTEESRQSYFLKSNRQSVITFF